jgi:NAD-dependent DNA ligase
MKEPLQKLVVAISGDFGKDRTRKQLKQWIEVNGGQFANSISADVTQYAHSFRIINYTLTIH